MATSYSYYKEEVSNFLKGRFDKTAKVLDVGAGEGTYYKYLGDYFENMEAVEVFKPNIDKYGLRNMYKAVWNCDIRDFEYNFYDIIIFGDVIEHLDVNDAQKVLKYAYDRCEELIVAIPYELEQGICENNEYEIHKQPDLTVKIMKERYPYLRCLYRNNEYGYYVKDDTNDEEKTVIETVNTNNIKVSVIIPIYNQEKLVIKCLDSIPKRDDIEIICVNDASIDNTLVNLKEYKKNIYDKLKIITYKKNKGVSYARNQGLEASKGEYVIFVDSDDYLYPDAFNAIIDTYLKGQDVIYYAMENNYDKVWYVNSENLTIRVGMFKFIRKEFIGDLRFEVGKQYAEDRDFTLKLLDMKPNICYTDIVMYHYNYPRSGSLSALGENRK